MISNVRISGSQTFPYSESDIRINYNNTSQIIAGANANVTAGGTGQGQFFSSDGGATWKQTSLAMRSSDDFQSDPTVDWTSDGTAWTIAIGFDSGQTHLRLHAYKSTDGGQTWTYDADASGTQTATDKEMMWVDHSPTSTHKDNIYVIWHNGSPVFVNRRTGPGGSWQTPIQVSGAETTGTGIGGDIKTNSAGDVFAFWPDTGSRNMFVAKSTDGGATFGNPVTIATTFDSFDIGIPCFNDRRALIYTSGGAFKTSTKDLVYAVWMDQTGVTGCNSAGNEPGSNVSSDCKTRIWFSRSTNGGANWSTPMMINNQSSRNDQFNPRLVVDETNGQLAVIYYDTIGDPGRLKTDVWMQTSDNDGVTWGNAVRVTTSQTDETISGADISGGSFFGDQYGDYNGITGFAGTIYPCWTDRRGGAREEIWSAIIRTLKGSSFIIQRSTYGQDEVNALLGNPPTVVFIPEAFWVAVDGFSAADLQLNFSNLNNPPIKPNVAFSPAVSGLSAHCTGVIPEDYSLPAAPQRFRFAFEVIFTDSTGFNWPGSDDHKLITLSSTLTAVGTTVTASGQIELVKQANPYLTSGEVSWLSIDLRVFQLREGDTKFGIVKAGGVGGATGFIQSVTTALKNGGGSAGGQTYENDLSIDEDTSAIQLFPTDMNGNAVFNYAIARVRLRGLTTNAHHVRVFFRLFAAQSTGTSYDPNTSYRSHSDGILNGHRIALAGILNNEYVTIPCFATVRVDPTTTSMNDQTDDPNVNDININPTGDEVDTFFGVWLDTNQPSQKILPTTPPATNPDGPFSGTLLSVQEAILASPHQCLVAEIAFDPIAIPAGVDPSTTDKLAQRNLAFGPAPNPGVAASRRVPQPFEMTATAAEAHSAGLPPDELMIDWNNVPDGSTAQIYLPAVSADMVLEMAQRMYASNRFQRTDDHTLQVPASGVTYLPIPPKTDVNYAGLLTIDLPKTIHKGEEYQVVVRQLTSAEGRGYTPPPPVIGRITKAAAGKRDLLQWRRVKGAFQLTIPVSTKEALLPERERLLSIIRWMEQAIIHRPRWHPVFQRYVEQIAGTVEGMGGYPGQILPSPTGEWQKPHPHYPPEDEGKAEERISTTGKVNGLIYDHFGDFEGFLLETEDGERRFYSRERRVEELVQRAWMERIRVTVWYERGEPHEPESIVLRS